MSLFSPLFYICFTEESGREAAAFTRAMGYPDAHVITGGFYQAIQALHLRATSPDYIIIDIAQHEIDILPSIDHFAHHCEAKVRVAVVGQSKDAALAQALKQLGIIDYFTQPVVPEAIRSALILASSPPDLTWNSDAKGLVISCMSAASGDGSSTIAMNLAAYLAAQSGESVVLVDMDYQFGLISKNLELVAPFGIRELFDHPERGLDDMLVSKMLVEYKPNLSIVAAPTELQLLPDISPKVVRELMGILRKKFDYVVVDVPHLWSGWTAATLSYSNTTIMVAQLWLRSLAHASRLLSAWHSVGISREAIMLVVNRSGAKFKEAITAQDFERICRRPIDAYVANDSKAITMAENQAKTLFDIPLESTVQTQIASLAKAIMAQHGKTLLASSPLAKKSLLSRVVKK